MLKSGELIYYTAPNGSEKGRVYLDPSLRVESVKAGAPVADGLAPGVQPKTPTPAMTFRLSAKWKEGPRNFYFAADSEFDLNQWLGHLGGSAPQPSAPAMGAAAAASPPPAGQNPMDMSGMLAGAMQLQNQMQQPAGSQPAPPAPEPSAYPMPPAPVPTLAQPITNK